LRTSTYEAVKPMKKPEDVSEFISIAAAKGTERVSALFYHIMHNGLDVFYGVPTVTRITELKPPRRAYLLELAMHANLCNLSTHLPQYIKSKYPTIKLADRHVSIYEKFGTENSELAKKKLLSHWHYTERYNIGDGKWIAVHVYFHYGIYVGTYIKEPTLTVVKVDDMATQALLNCRDAYELVMLAINTMVAKKKSLNNEYEALCESLFQMSFLQSATDDSIATALSKIAALDDLLGNYQEDINPSYLKRRHNNLCQRITLLRSQFNSAKTVVAKDLEEDKNDTTTVKALPVAGAKPVPAKRKQEPKAIDQIHKEFNALKAEQSQCTTAEQYLKLAAKIQQLKDELVITYVNAPESESATARKCLVIEKALKALPTLTQIFINFANDYNYDQTIELFPYVKAEIPPVFYLKFYVNLCLKYDKIKEQCILKLIDFFYVNSADYRLLVSYPKSINYALNLPNGDLLGVNPLLNLVKAKRFDIFKALINQLNTFDIQGGLVDNRSILLIEAICLISTDNNHDPFIQQLLDFAVVTENSFPFAQGVTCKIEPAKSDSKIAPLIEGIEYTTPYNCDDPNATKLAVFFKNIFKDSPYLGSALSAYCIAEYCSPTLLARLAKKSSDIHLLLGLGYYSFKEIGLMTVYTTNKYGVKSEAIGEKRTTIAAELLSVAAGNVKYIGNIMGSKEPYKHSCCSILITEAVARMDKLSQVEIKNLIKMLQATSNTYEQGGYTFGALACQKALILVVGYLEPSVENHRLVLHTMVKCANCYLLDKTSSLKEKSNLAQAQIYFIHAMQFSENSIYKDALIQDIKYTEAMLKYNPKLLPTNSSGVSVSLKPQ